MTRITAAENASSLIVSPGICPTPGVGARRMARLGLCRRSTGAVGRHRGRIGALRVAGARRFDGDPVAQLDILSRCSASKRRISRAVRDSLAAMSPARK